ncbi:MAG: hypothetical protein ACRD22_20670, partial [Terriglobia bacterium]
MTDPTQPIRQIARDHGILRRLCFARRSLRRSVTPGGAAALVVCLLFALTPAVGRAQEVGRKKVPGLSKIESNGATNQVFTGGVQTLDSRSKVLEVSSADGASSAIFP